MVSRRFPAWRPPAVDRLKRGGGRGRRGILPAGFTLHSPILILVRHHHYASRKGYRELSWLLHRGSLLVYGLSIHARCHNVDIYRANSNVVDRGRERQSREKRGVNGRGRKRMLSFDKYLTLPPNCARVAYASCLYDKIVLCHSENCADSTTIRVNHDDDNDNHLQSQLFIFLHKLLGLAATNARIREVIMLILLETKRRLCRQKMLRLHVPVHPCRRLFE